MSVGLGVDVGASVVKVAMVDATTSGSTHAMSRDGGFPELVVAHGYPSPACRPEWQRRRDRPVRGPVRRGDPEARRRRDRHRRRRCTRSSRSPPRTGGPIERMRRFAKPWSRRDARRSRLVSSAEAAVRGYRADSGTIPNTVAVLDLGAYTCSAVVISDCQNEPDVWGTQPCCTDAAATTSTPESSTTCSPACAARDSRISRTTPRPSRRRASSSQSAASPRRPSQNGRRSPCRSSCRARSLRSDSSAPSMTTSRVRPCSEIVQVLKEAIGAGERDVDAVLLVGGGAPIPIVMQQISVELGLPVLLTNDPSTLAARGAALESSAALATMRGRPRRGARLQGWLSRSRSHRADTDRRHRESASVSASPISGSLCSLRSALQLRAESPRLRSSHRPTRRRPWARPTWSPTRGSPVPMAHETTTEVDRVGQAEESAAAGDHDGALRILDGVLAHPDHIEFGAAVRIAAAIHGHRGMLHRSAELYPARPAGDHRGRCGRRSPDVDRHRRHRRAGPMLVAAEHGSPTSVASSMRAMARGLEQTLTGDGTGRVLHARPGRLVDGAGRSGRRHPGHAGFLGGPGGDPCRRAGSRPVGAAPGHRGRPGWSDVPGPPSGAARLDDDAARRSCGRGEEGGRGARAGRVGPPQRAVRPRRAGRRGEAEQRHLRPRRGVAPRARDPPRPLRRPLQSASARRAGRCRGPPAGRTPGQAAAGCGVHAARHAWAIHRCGRRRSTGTASRPRSSPSTRPTSSRTRTRWSTPRGSAATPGCWREPARRGCGSCRRTSTRRRFASRCRISTASACPGTRPAWPPRPRPAPRTVRPCSSCCTRRARSSSRRPPGATDPATSSPTGSGRSARLVVDGIGYREIGERLFISPKTVEHHVASIRRRLGSTSRKDMLATLKTLVEASGSS